MFLIANIRLINRSNEALTILKIFCIVYRMFSIFKRPVSSHGMRCVNDEANPVGSEFSNYLLKLSSKSIKVVICDLQVKFVN